MSDGRLFILSAPSGAGKTTLAKLLAESLADTVLSISHTTRLRRDGEQDGVDYYFVDRVEFEAMVAGDEFLEYAEVFGNLYGTSRSTVEALLKLGKNVLLDIDWQGARKVRDKMPGVQSVFILPPSRRELERRLRERGQDTETVIARRMQDAAEEISHHSEYQYVVVNDDIDRAVVDLQAIVAGRGDNVREVSVDMQALLQETG